MAWMTTEDAANHTRYSTKTILRAAQSGELRGFQPRAGSAWRFEDWEVNRWVKNREGN